MRSSIHDRIRVGGCLSVVAAAMLLSSAASAHVISEKREEDRFIYFLDTPFTPRAWAESDFNLRLQMFDILVVSVPNPEVGFMLDLPGATFVFFDHLELRVDGRMVLNPNDAGGAIAVDDPGAANAGNRDFLGADVDIPSWKAGLKWAFIKDEKSHVRFAVGVDGIFGVLNTPKHKHFDGGPFLSPYDVQLHGYFSLALSLGKNFGMQLHGGGTVAWDFERKDIFPGQDLSSTDIWVDYSLTLDYLFRFSGTAAILGLNGRDLVSGVTSNMVEDQVSVFGGFVFAVGTATDVSVALQVPVYSGEFRDYFDFAVVANWSMDWPELSFFGEKKDDKNMNALPTVVRESRIADCPPGGPSKLTFTNETAYTLVIEYSDTPETPPGPASAPASGPAAAPAPAAAAGAKAPESVPTKTVTVKPAASVSLDYSILPTSVKISAKAEGATDVPAAEGNARLSFCGNYVIKFDKDSMKTAEALKKAKKDEKK